MPPILSTNGSPLLFNNGGEQPSPNNPSIGPVLNEANRSRYVMKIASEKTPFTQMSKFVYIPLHTGLIHKRTIMYPIIDDRNINHQGIDGNGYEMTPGVWYAYDATGQPTEFQTEADARAMPGVEYVKSGNGNLYGGSRDVVLQQGAMPELGEIGGVSNGVGFSRKIISAKIKRYGFSTTYTKMSMMIDSQDTLLLDVLYEMGVAFGKVKETIVRTQLLSAGLINATYCGGALSMDEVDETCGLTVDALDRLRESLNIANVPHDTRILTGSRNIDTRVINRARYLFVPTELETTIKYLTKNNKEVFIEYPQYAGQDGSGKAQDEIGKVGDFRIIVSNTMSYWAGGGASATDGVDTSGSGIEDAGETKRITRGRYDVLPLLFVGSDSYELLGLHGDTQGVSVKHKAPEIVQGIDHYADRGVISVQWHQGIIVYRPERIRVLLCSAEK